MNPLFPDGAFRWILILAVLFGIASPRSSALAADHDSFADTLAPHVEEGRVRYDRMLGSRVELDTYTESLRLAPPRGSPAERKTYWINAYNALVIRSILEAYPIRSTRDVKDFEVRLDHSIAGDLLSLRQIRREKLLAEFKDPRLHFVLCRGAVSAPPLAARPYRPETLDADLDAAVRAFLAGPSGVRVDIQARTVRLPAIFHWYASDFVASGRETSDPEPALRTFVLTHGPEDAQAVLRLNPPYTLSIRRDYDWRLNGVHMSQKEPFVWPWSR